MSANYESEKNSQALKKSQVLVYVASERVSATSPKEAFESSLYVIFIDFCFIIINSWRGEKFTRWEYRELNVLICVIVARQLLSRVSEEVNNNFHPARTLNRCRTCWNVCASIDMEKILNLYPPLIYFSSLSKCIEDYYARHF